MIRLVVLLGLVSCAQLDPTPIRDPDASAVQLLVHVTRAATPRDVLVVKDRSSAIAPYEANLDTELDSMADVLDRWDDVHIGVLSADPADPARISMLVTHRDMLGIRTKNFDGDLASNLRARTNLGHESTRAPAPLDAIRRALADPANAGFRRHEARFAIVVISGADDASPATPAELADAVLATAEIGEVGVIVAAPQQSPRFAAFGTALPNRFGLYPIDNLRGDLSSVLFVYGPCPLWSSSCSDWPACVERPLFDMDPSTPGLQPECVASERLDGEDEESELEECDAVASVLPCWRLTEDFQNCGWSAEPRRFDVIRRDRGAKKIIATAQCRSARL